MADSRPDVVIFSDFRHGIFNSPDHPELRERDPEGALKVADSQVSNRWGNILDFTGFDLMTPNEREARFALGDQDSVVRPLALELFRRARCKHLILKLGRAGHDRLPDAGPHAARVLHGRQLRGHPQGPDRGRRRAAGYASLALAATGNIVIASILGAMAAAVACEHRATGRSPRER